MLRSAFRNRGEFYSLFSFLLLIRSQVWGLEEAALPKIRSGFPGKVPGSDTSCTTAVNIQS